MKTKQVGIIGGSLAAAIVAWACVGQAQQRVGEKVGEKLDNAGRAIKRGVQGAGASVREGFARTRASVHNQEVISRVYSRIHWDKALTTSTLELEVREPGVTVLTGSVVSAEAKKKAVALARDTVGVTQVIDQLTVMPPPRVIDAPPDVETTRPINPP